MNHLKNQIRQLLTEKNAVIMAHYYVEDSIQEVANYVGDSYYLSKIATEIEADVIVVCGVFFMGESVKLLNPHKTVLLPDVKADCPMAHMADENMVAAVRQQYQDLAVVCYVNSSARLKAASDVCVTSANAYKVVKALPNKNIYFIPDEHLGHYIAQQLPEKNFILHQGFCPVHKGITPDVVLKEKKAHNTAKFLVHPECCQEVCELADYVGSTAEIIEYATRDDCQEFIIGTEVGVAYELQRRNPEKHFYLLEQVCCQDMKKLTLEKVAQCLQNGSGEVCIDPAIAGQALTPLEKMLELATSHKGGRL